MKKFMSRQLLVLSAVLSLSYAGTAAAQEDEGGFDFSQEEIGPNCTTGAKCIGYYNTFNDCNGVAADKCLTEAQAACGAHNGVSSYNCTSCTDMPNPAYGCESGANKFSAHLTYTCND